MIPLLIRVYALAAVLVIYFGWHAPGLCLYASSVCFSVVYWTAKTP